MPVNKSALARYLSVIRLLQNESNRYHTKEQIIERIEEDTNQSISVSLFEKDLHALRECHDLKLYVPIEYDTRIKAYKIEENWKLSEMIRLSWLL